MTPKLKVNVKEVRRCSKPGCNETLVHRHHKGNEAWFIAILDASPFSAADTHLKIMRSRYDKFLSEDTVDICAPHHAEIHKIYRELWEKEKERLFARGVRTWTFKLMERMMDLFRAACDEWLEEETPGVDPKTVFTAPDRGNKI